MHKAKYSKFALVLLALAATACTTAPVQTPVAGASAGASPSPTATASAAATPTPGPSGSASAAPSATPTNQGGAVNPKLVILSGTVYDEAGAPVDGATVTVNSLDPANQYTASTKTNQGSYVVNNVPEGVNVEIIATKANWTSRRRVGSFQALATARNQIDFGSALGDTTSAGAAYFISMYPEVAKTEPAYNAANVDPSTLVYKLTLSEPLDSTNQNRFANAIRLFPANKQAAPTGNFKDMQDVEDTQNDYNPDTVGQWAYSIRKGSLFLNDANTRANVNWDATGTVATLTFNAPLIADRNDVAKYQVGLVAGSDAIVDPFNHQLGTDKAGSLTAYPSSGNLIRHVFLPNSLAITGTPATGPQRWSATHQSVSVFTVAQDLTTPKLLGVNYTKNLGNDSRFELTFSEPMAAYNGTNIGRMDPSLTNGNVLDTLTFAVSDRIGGTSKDLLRGSAGSPQTFGFNTGSPQLANGGTWGSSSSQVDAEFKLDKAAFTSTSRISLTAPADTGKITIEANPSNPKMIFIYVFNRANIFDSRMAEIKTRLEGAGDPAGNLIKSADADNNQVTNPL